jgi:beta-lactamase regulating signal transducer with metallopeptidase domain
MMSVLIAIALKSLLIAGLSLALLALMKERSAAQRSWVAHIGLLALVVMAFAPLAVPSWNVQVPALFHQSPPTGPAVALPVQTVQPTSPQAKAGNVGHARQAASPLPRLSAEAAASAVYAVPALMLLLITFLALARLVALRARAEVLVDGHWLTALARAQRRMGFKHGTALLTSNALASPISWGIMRPVILLNTRAVEAAGEAEAIIAHELAHVARMDWLKLLLARLATALFWFNPLVWMLAREAHQLREEAADDAVLGADIVDTDYAELLVGVARHECPGLLLGAHGVAPSKNSLARRVARVLDGKSVRGPVGTSFAAGVFVGAIVVAAPLAALTFTPAGSASDDAASGGAAAPGPRAVYAVREVPADLPHIIANGVSTSVATAAAAIAPAAAVAPRADLEAISPGGAKILRRNGTVVATSPSGASVIVYPADAQGHSRVVATSPGGATSSAYMNASDVALLTAMRAARAGSGAVDTAIGMRALGASPDYVAAIRGASPAMRAASDGDIMGLRAIGVTPQYVRELSAAGLPDLSPEAITEAHAVGLTGAYVRAIRATGVPTTLEDLVKLRSLNIRAEELARVRGPLTKERIRGLVAPPPPQPPPPPPGSDDR